MEVLESQTHALAFYTALFRVLAPHVIVASRRAWPGRLHLSLVSIMTSTGKAKTKRTESERNIFVMSNSTDYEKNSNTRSLSR